MNKIKDFGKKTLNERRKDIENPTFEQEMALERLEEINRNSNKSSR